MSTAGSVSSQLVVDCVCQAWCYCILGCDILVFLILFSGSSHLHAEHGSSAEQNTQVWHPDTCTTHDISCSGGWQSPNTGTDHISFKPGTGTGHVNSNPNRGIDHISSDLRNIGTGYTSSNPGIGRGYLSCNPRYSLIHVCLSLWSPASLTD